MQLPTPLMNNALVEIIGEYEGVSRSTENESQKKGKIVGFNIEQYHLTASAAIDFSDEFIAKKNAELDELVKAGATVYWEEFANEGQTFEYEGKNYAFVAWWRLTGEAK